MLRASRAEKQPIFWRSECVMGGWAHTWGEEGTNAFLINVFWCCGEKRRQKALLRWCKIDDAWPQTFWCLKTVHRRFYFYLCVYIYLKKNKNNCLVLISRKGNVLVVTQYSVHAYLSLGVCQYMQWRHRKKQRKTSRLLVCQFTSFLSWISMEILKAKTLCNEQSPSTAETKKTEG